MSKYFRSNYVAELAKDLESLARILAEAQGYGLRCRDTGVLHQAATACQQSIGESSWGYDVRMIFEVEPGRHAVPTVGDVTLEMVVDIRGHAREKVDFLADPLEMLVFEIEMQALAKEGTKHRCAWHLDRQKDGVDPPEHPHPRYHFQFGGRRMRKNDYPYYGASLLLDAPRLAYPPLDAVLGVDFVLSNFAGPIWHRLMDGEYRGIVVRAQERLWRPYLTTLSTVWTAVDPKAWQPTDAWPSLLPSPIRPK